MLCQYDGFQGGFEWLSLPENHYMVIILGACNFYCVLTRTFNSFNSNSCVVFPIFCYNKFDHLSFQRRQTLGELCAWSLLLFLCAEVVPIKNVMSLFWWRLHLQICFFFYQITRNMFLVTVLLSILNWINFHLVQNGRSFFSLRSYSMRFERKWKSVFVSLEIIICILPP